MGQNVSGLFHGNDMIAQSGQLTKHLRLAKFLHDHVVHGMTIYRFVHKLGSLFVCLVLLKSVVVFFMAVPLFIKVVQAKTIVVQKRRA
jgi:hypothetical protein